jgi:hypothetical protein
MGEMKHAYKILVGKPEREEIVWETQAQMGV